MFEPQNKLGDISKFSSRASVYDYKAIKLELSSACNAKCKFCTMFRNKNKPHDFLTIENTINFIHLNVAWLNRENYYIEPFFNGESLLNPHFFEILALLKDNSIAIGDLDSNFGLEFDIMRFSAIPWRSVTVNIGGISPDVHEKVMGTPFNTVISNIKQLLSSPFRKFPVYLKMNPVADNLHEQKDLAQFTHELSPELKWKSQQTGIPVPSDLSQEQLASVIKDIYSYDYDDFFRFSPDNNSFISIKNNNCIYKLPCINANGSVTVCSHDQLRHLDCGNAFKTSLEQIFQSDLYRKCLESATNRLLPFCKGCN